MDCETDSTHSICFIDLTDESNEACIQKSFDDIVDEEVEIPPLVQAENKPISIKKDRRTRICDTPAQIIPQIDQENKPINNKKKRTTRKSENPGTTQTRSAFHFYVKKLKQRGVFVNFETSVTSWNTLKRTDHKEVKFYDGLSLTDRVRFDSETNVREFRKQRQQNARINKLKRKTKCSSATKPMR